MNTGHPRRSQLALYAGGDLGFLGRATVGRHLRACARCAEAVDAFRLDRETLRTDAAELPAGVDWKRLSAEMTANIRVGLAAGRCVEERKRSRQWFGTLGFKPAAAFASVAAILAGGLWLSFPAGPGAHMSNAARLRRVMFQGSLRTPAPFDNVVTMASTEEGLELKQNGAVMRIAQPGATQSLVTASAGGSVRARYIDDDTGQVTITNVYSQ